MRTHCAAQFCFWSQRGRSRCGVDARIAPPFMEATDASRLVCVVVVSYKNTHSRIKEPGCNPSLALRCERCWLLCGIGLDAAVHRLRYGGLHVGLLHAMVRHWVADSIRRVSYGWDTDVLLWCMLHLRLLRPRLRTVTRDATMRKANWRLGRSARWRVVRWRVGGVVAAE